jgi:NAD(P)H dehydrogenase (quinone)
MKIAITTASGQLGQATIGALQGLDAGHEIIGLARTPAKAQGLGIEIRPGDYDAPDQLHASLNGIDVVFLISGNQDPSLRVQQHRNIIEAAKAKDVGKIVFTSVQGAVGAPAGSVGATFMQTEADIKASGLDYVIGRNGVYIEPDVEYIDTYAKLGEIANSAGDARCGYTTRSELAFAYAHLIAEPVHNGQTYNLHGTPISQAELAQHLSKTFDVPILYRAMSNDAYLADRIGELGDFMGPIIAGIYENMATDALDNPSDFAAAAGRDHISWADYFASIKHTNNQSRGQKC